MREHSARVRVAAKLVEAPRGAEPDGVRREARQRERPRREPGERDERGADTRQEDDVPQRDEPVLRRVEHREHPVTALRVRGAHKVRERVEVRELPREHQREQRPRRERVVQCRCCCCFCQRWGKVERESAWEEGAADGCPAHEGRDCTDDGADPGVPDRAAFHPGVRPRVERDVGHAEEGRRRSAHRPEERGAREARGGRKGGCVRGAQGAAHERASARARHLRVVGDLLQLVERVGGGAAEGRAEGRREQHGDGRGDWGERDAGHGDEYVEGGEACF